MLHSVGLTSLTPRAGPEPVFNLEVANEHTYYVSRAGLLVHNAGRGKYLTEAGRQGKLAPKKMARPENIQRANKKLPTEEHHFATNKNKQFTLQFEEIANKYGLKLNGSWNKYLLPNRGRHPNKYHEFVQENMQNASREAGNDVVKFLNLFERYVKEPVRLNPLLLRKIGWQ